MSQSILLNSMISPVRLAMRTSTPRSILRRPSALPLSPTPFPFHSNFSVMVSPSMKSPHVQFMASPQLVATFTTHSSEAYDRAPIKVSPNPLALPRRGDRYYSPSVENFKLADAPKPKAAVQRRLDSILRNSQECASPAITEFEDPRSPKAQVSNTQQQQQQVVRFASFAELPERSPQDLSKSIHSYPRSPYPSATEFLIEERGRGMDEGAMSEPLATKTRSQSVEGTAPRKAKAPARGPASFKPMPSPLQQSFNVPLTAGLQRSHKPAPLALEPQVDTGALNEAFWNAVSLEVVESPMVTALEYPAPADDLEDIDLESPDVAALKSPGLMFANQNGEVWSPSAKTSATAPRESLLRDALMSPGKVAFGRVKRSLIASPTPHDPFASFPSFSAVLSLESTSDSTITYPAPAVVAD